jgi:hypothetical protein
MAKKKADDSTGQAAGTDTGSPMVAGDTGAHPAARRRGRKPGRKKLSKMEAVRRALDEYGPDVKPLKIKDHLKKRYKLNISADMASTYKGNILRKSGQSATIREPQAATSSRKAAEPALHMGDVQAVKDLADRLGTDQVRQLLDMFGH